MDPFDRKTTEFIDHSLLLGDNNFIMNLISTTTTENQFSKNATNNVELPYFQQILPAETTTFDDKIYLTTEPKTDETFLMVVNDTFARSKKVLPHKKRISRKVAQSITDTHIELHPKEQLPNFRYTCEICGQYTTSQISFFAHLKEHYEPELITPTKTTFITSSSTECATAVCPDVSKESKDHAVRLDFENFPNEQVVDSSPNDMKILDTSSIEKCIHFTNVAPPMASIINADEIEFSETEDMLEPDLCDVVAKVSIEDSMNDEIDLITSNGLREHWLSSNNDVSFSGAFAQMLGAEEISDTQKLVPFPSTTTCQETIPKPKTDDTSYSDNAKATLNFDCNTTHQVTAICAEDTNISSNSNCNRKECEDFEDQLDCQSIDEDHNELPKSNKHFYCDECMREFNSANALKYHNRTHRGIRPYKCDVCERAFFAQGALKSHIRTHTGEKPFKCEICRKKFRQWGDLKYHTTSIHTDEKSHQCEFCGKAFSRKYSLVVHLRIHEDERNYKCDFCDKAFRASSYLQNHRKIHTGEKPHECTFCLKRFRVFGDLRRHVRIHQRSLDEKARGK